MKLVTKETIKLGSKGGAWLKGLVDAAADKDANYFKFQKNLRNYLSGKHWENVKGVTKQEIKMVINLAHAHVRTLVPTLFFQNPSLDCAPTAPKYVGREQTWNGVINNTLDKTNFAEEAKKAVFDSVVYQEGVLKDVVNRVQNTGDTAGQTNSEVGTQGPTVWLDKGAPVHVRINPAQLLVDHLVADRDTDNARFVVVRYKRLLSELKKHPIYGKNIKADYKTKTSEQPTTGNYVKKTVTEPDDWDDMSVKQYKGCNETLVTIYECWIHQLISEDGEFEIYQKMCVLLEDQDEPIRELEDWSNSMGEGFNRFPVTRLVLNPVPDSVPQSELGVTQDMQQTLNWLMSRLTSLVENDRLLYGVDVGSVKNMAKFRQDFYKGLPRTLVELQGNGKPISEMIGLIQPSFAGRDNYQLLSLIQTFYQQVSGIGQNRRGSSGIRTATEASLIDQGTQIKTDEKVDTVSKFLIRVLTKNAMMTRALVKQDNGVQWVFRIGGDSGAVNWLSFTKEDIDWMPEIRIRVNSFRKMDSMQEMQKYVGLLQIGVQMFQLFGPQIRVDIMFKRLLESAGIHDADKIVGNQDAQTMLQMIELAGVIAGGVETPILPEQNHVAHIAVIDQFMQSMFGQQIIAMQPEVMDRLAQHRAGHEQMLMEQQEKAARASAGANPFEAGEQGSPNAQSIANDGTSGDRQPMAVSGGNGEMA